MTSRPVTLADVARLAGVSYQTVSRVLNHSTQVTAETQQRVTAAIQQLNYVPNRVAQQLAGKATRTIGLATSELSLLAPAQIASAIQHRAAALGYHVVIAMANQPGFDAAQAAVNELLAQRVDGLLINLPLQNAQAQALEGLAAHLPFLFMDVAQHATVHQCQYDAAHGARLGVEHLVALGHRRIALLNGPAHSVAATQRFAAWQAALAHHQLQPHAVLTGDWSAASGYQAALTLLPNKLPEAMLIANDQMALGVLRALHQYGVSIPQTVSLVGYDDTEESAWYQPPLTTIRQDLRHLGALSVDRLLQLIGKEMLATTCPLETELVIRETTAPRADHAVDHAAIAQQLRILAQRLEEGK
ncbi:LacI family DNA-binding transcriptional regulator [Paramixta manurensis]